MLQLITKNFSLHHTLSCGQTFCWKQLPASASWQWQGYIYDIPCLARQVGNVIIFEGSAELDESLVRRYFNLTPAWDQILSSLPDDSWLNQARKEVAGLRCVHEPWWECTANFICSSLKQIPQIEQINQNLRSRFGQVISGTSFYRFPSAETLATLSEKDLRDCKLGYRAKHLFRAAHQVSHGAISWNSLEQMPLQQASCELQKLAGVGEKVAHCILLYAGNHLDAFPFDVWVFRLMHELYYPKRRAMPDQKTMDRKAQKLFGATRGIAQHYLFHWYRTCYMKSR
jgi:N-glycosylase/DNA lyase